MIFAVLTSYVFSVWLTYITHGKYEPGPTPSALLPRLIGTIGGVLGAWIFNVALGVPTPQPALTGLPALSTTTGIFIGATLAIDIYRLAAGGRQIAPGPQ